MHVRAPHELDGVANGSVCREGNVAKDTLRRSDNDSVRDTAGTTGTRVAGTVTAAGRAGVGGRGRSVRRHWHAKLSNAF